LWHILEALFAANLNKVCSAVALKSLEVYTIPTPWLHQDTTTIALYGAYADAPQTPGVPRPAYGPSKDGRDDLQAAKLYDGLEAADWASKRNLIQMPGKRVEGARDAVNIVFRIDPWRCGPRKIRWNVAA
jgi:hypothetical protein